MADTHAELPDAGRLSHDQIDRILDMQRQLPINVWGERDDPEAALKNLLIALERLGFIRDGTSET